MRSEEFAEAYELTTVADIVDRYQRPGPHATVVMMIPTPGQVGEDLAVRWHVRRTELVHEGATDSALNHLDRAIETIEPRGAMAVLTANDDDAALCWLLDHEVVAMTSVGDRPRLLAAVDELAGRSPVAAAVVDHLGADLYRIDHVEIAERGSVKGDHVQTHRHTGGDQAGYQRRADAVYHRNADMIAKAVASQAAADAAHLIVLTGDDREIADVIEHLDTHRFSVVAVQAGARHEAGTPARLAAAANEALLADRHRTRAGDVDDLRRALGQHSLGAAGRRTIADAIREGRVATLLLDRGALPDDADRLAGDALLYGGRVVLANDLGATDGVGAILRYDTD